jgi:hypothetical protein
MFACVLFSSRALVKAGVAINVLAEDNKSHRVKALYEKEFPYI